MAIKLFQSEYLYIPIYLNRERETVKESKKEREGVKDSWSKALITLLIYESVKTWSCHTRRLSPVCLSGKSEGVSQSVCQSVSLYWSVSQWIRIRL